MRSYRVSDDNTSSSSIPSASASSDGVAFLASLLLPLLFGSASSVAWYSFSVTSSTLVLARARACWAWRCGGLRRRRTSQGELGEEEEGLPQDEAAHMLHFQGLCDDCVVLVSYKNEIDL